MKRKFNVMAISALLSGSILFSSCIGSFSLFNKLLSWNNTVGDEFINELVFIAFCIVPVYPIAWFADALIFNSIEFWTGENPVIEGSTTKASNAKGDFTITVEKEGYRIEKEGSDEVVEFHYNQENKIWSLYAGGESTPLFQFTGEKEVIMFLPNGQSIPATLDRAGVLAFKQTLSHLYFAAQYNIHNS